MIGLPFRDCALRDRAEVAGDVGLGKIAVRGYEELLQCDDTRSGAAEGKCGAGGLGIRKKRRCCDQNDGNCNVATVVQISIIESFT